MHFDKYENSDLQEFCIENALLYWVDFLIKNDKEWKEKNPQKLREKFKIFFAKLYFPHIEQKQIKHPFLSDSSKTIEAEYGGDAFLCPVFDLPENDHIRYIFESVFYHKENKSLYTDFMGLNIFQRGEDDIPSYSEFVRYIANYEDYKNEIIDIIHKRIEKKIRLLAERLKQERNFNPFERVKVEDIYFDNMFADYNFPVNNKPEKIVFSPTNEDFITRLLRENGFPYKPTQEEYFRYLETFNKNILFAMVDYNKKHILNCNFPASKFYKLLWKAPIDRKDFISHTYVVARSGSGKSEFLKTLIREMGGSCILLDPHGDLANSLDGKKGFLKVAPDEKRFVINPFDITDKSIKNRQLVAQEITDLIGELVTDSGLSSLMDTVVKPVIQTLLKLPYSDFAMLADCFSPVSGVERLEALTPLVDDTIRNWDAITGDQYETSKKSIFNRLVSFLNNGIVRDTVCGLDDFGDVIGRIVQGENLAVSIPSPTIGGNVSEILGRFFMCRMQIWAKSRHSIPEHLRTPVFLIVDECQNFLSKMTANTLDQFGRKFGLFMVLSHQHIKQIDDTALKDSILTNCKNKIVGQASKATRQALASEMGLEQSDFEGLGRGYYWGTFEYKGTMKFYSQMVKFKDTGDGVQYATSQNRAYVNGWDIVGDDIAPDTRTHAKTQEKTRKPPKYDV